jgi:hypothetical protein
MRAYGLRGTYEKVRAANGPAQHIACAMCGLIMAGMFVTHVDTTLICIWGSLSIFVVLATVWLPRVFLKYTLLADFVFSMVILFQYMMYEAPKPMQNVYYTMTATGMDQAVRPMTHMPMTTVDEIAHAAALIWLAGWSLYLANLVHRQILEHKRFVDVH